MTASDERPTALQRPAAKVTPPPPGRLVVVSNRLPLTLRRSGGTWRAEPSSGGLITALEPVLKRCGGLWLGWPGEAEGGAEAERRAVLEHWEGQGYAAVDLPHGLVSGFYHGYSNATLWPTLHHFPSRFEYDPRDWSAYRDANLVFRDALVARLRPGDLVWVHDYHLMLLPSLLREARPDTTLGFFLHVPFPPPDVFRILPQREELLRGLLGADLIAFQTYGHLQHFRGALLRLLGIESEMDRVELPGRRARLGAFPIGIVPEAFVGLLDGDRRTAEALGELRGRYRDQHILLAVDRLDYTKGIPERLHAYRRLLEDYPQWRGRVVLIQVAVPSRERVQSYRELRQTVNGLVGEINGAFGTPEWTPVVYIRRPVPRTTLVALYAAADVGWVTPLRDGMNLVAKEYVACQRDGAGVLVLSEFAGAAAEMGEALLVNPYDEERTAATLAQALEMPVEERRERLAALRRRVTRNTATAWSGRFVDELGRARQARHVAGPTGPGPLPVDDVVAAWRACAPRLVLLDYDGTLVPLATRPQDATPPPELAALLARLAAVPECRLAVVSGRPARDLERFFGAVPGLYLAAEHGALVRDPDQRVWAPLRRAVDPSWKARVQPILEHFVDRSPGSFVEEKEYALVWHYRMSDPDFGEWLANELLATLDELLASTELRAVRGRKSVEVRMIWAHKGEVAVALQHAGRPQGFQLALGDDVTDEDVFVRLGPGAFTVHVGDGCTSARYVLPEPGAVRRLLKRLAAESPAC